MHNPFVIGAKLYLRGLETLDLEGDYFNWLNDLEVTKYLSSGFFPNTKDKMEQFYRNVALNPDNVLLAIIDKESDKHIGNIKLGPTDWINRTTTLGIMIGDKSFWGKGYGAEAIEVVLAYAFNVLNLHKVNAGIAEPNSGSLKAFQKAGFEIEGRAKSQIFVDGHYADSIYVGITEEDFFKKDRGK